MVAIGLLLIDPYPGERAKVRLPFPFRYGTIAYIRDGFFVVYEFENAANDTRVHDLVAYRAVLGLA